MGPGETLPAILLGKAEPSESSIEEDPLELAGPNAHLVDLAQVPVGLARR